MKKFISCVIFTLYLLSGSLNAQWIPVNIGTTFNLSSVCIPANYPSTIFVLGYDTSNFSGALFKSTNSGVNWTTQQSFPVNFSYPACIGVNADTGLVCGAGGIIGTTNGGSNWSFLYAPTDTVVFWDMRVGPSGSIWAVGNKSSTTGLGSPVVIRSALEWWGSISFERLTLPASWSNYQLTSLCVKDSNNCIISTNLHPNTDKILKTTNGGLNWTEITLPSRTIWALIGDEVNNDVIGVGGDNDDATIYRSNDFGLTWNVIFDSSAGSCLSSVGSMYEYIRDTMYAVGKQGTIVRTIDGGTTWSFQNSGVTKDLESVSSAYQLSKFAFAVGDNGTTLKTTNGGVRVKNISSEVPKQFSLFQNYPNPFNPMTNIRFDLPKNGYVKLIVFDALGREVATLVNEKLSVGSYEVNWDVNGFPSGVYFYKLMTEDYYETKKMILTK